MSAPSHKIVPLMIRTALLAIVLAIASLQAALALDRMLTVEETRIIQAIGRHHSQIGSMAGRFLQIDTQGNRIEGTFFLDRPDKIRFRYGPPSKEEIISVGRGFYVINREERTKYAYPQDRVPLRQFLSDRIDFFSANLQDVVLTDDFISIVIADDSPIGTVEVALIFEVDTLELRQWTLTEPSGAQLTFSVYEVEKNVDIPRAFFYIDPTYSAPAQ